MKTSFFSPCVLLILLSMPRAKGETKGVAVGDVIGYREVVVTKVEVDGLRIRHADGLAKVPIERVPEELRARFGLTEERAEAHRTERAEKAAEQRRARQVAAEEARLLGPVTFEVCEPVVRVLADGVLVDGFGYTDGEKAEVRCYERVRMSGPTTLSPCQPLVMGRRLAGVRWELVRKFMEGPVFIERAPGDLADGDALTATLYRSGTRVFTTPEGGVLTLKRFVTDRRVALAELRENADADSRDDVSQDERPAESAP